MTGRPNLPQDFATEWKELRELAEAAFTAANSDKILVGKIEVFAGPAANVPDGWLVCDGAAVSRTTFADLFGQIGTAWGVGDGSTTFNVPDLRDRVLVGSELSFAVGDTGGSATSGSGGNHSHGGSTGSQSVPHTHGSSGSHSHSNPSTGTAGSHSHGGSTGNNSNVVAVDAGGIDSRPAAFHAHSISGDSGHTHTQGSTGSTSHEHSSSSITHDHSIGAEASHTHSVQPPFAAVLPIIRY